jgi:maleate cis-trans isomerase
MTVAAMDMIRLGILYPPTGSEFEYYAATESMTPPVRAYVVGVRIAGGEREHEPKFLRQTAAVENLLLSARSLKPLHPHAVMWACTSGSFIDGLDFARHQADELSRELRTPCSSTSLAFVSALQHLRIDQVAMLASYPAETTQAFVQLLAEAGIVVSDQVSLDAMSGPDAARLGDARLKQVARRLRVPHDGALLIPDTAMPTLGLIPALEESLGCVVLSANQVTLWEGLRLADGALQQKRLGRLFA